MARKGVIRHKVVRTKPKGLIGYIRYKVTRRYRGAYRSCIVSPTAPHFVRYRLGKRSEAPLGGILVFRTKRQANAFRSSSAEEHKYVVLRCVCDEAVRLRSRAYWTEDTEDCKRAWSRSDERGWPAGTEAYRYVTPLEVVT